MAAIYDLDNLLKLPQQVGTLFSIDGVTLLKIVNKNNAFCILKRLKIIIFPTDKMTVAFFGASEEGCLSGSSL